MAPGFLVDATGELLFSSNRREYLTQGGDMPFTTSTDIKAASDKAMAKEASLKPGSVNQLDQSPIHQLHRAGQCAADIFQAEMGLDDLTPRQYAVLLTVSQNEGLSQTQLVDKTGIDRSTLADIVRRMLKKGLLSRRRTREDARAYAVKLTDEGWRSLKAADPVAKRVDERILSALPAQQRDRFLSDLNMIVQALGKFRDNPTA